MTTMTMQEATGSEALAFGALAAGVQFVTGYPGSPATSVVEALLRHGSAHLRIEWATNEKSAFDAAFGASLARVRSLLCVKSVGLNVALDSLMVGNLAGGDGGFVILVGDDPGGWGSQNEEDSRLLAAAAEVPILEPTSATEAYTVMRRAFDLSEQVSLPVVVHITRALALDPTAIVTGPPPTTAHHPPDFQRQPERFNVLPIHVVDFHRRLQATLERVQAQFEHSPLNAEEGRGRQGIIAAGYASQKLNNILVPDDHPTLTVLRLSTLHPLPANRIAVFMRQVDAVLVLEETASFIETQVQAIAHRAGLTLPIYGRHSGHLPTAGELSKAHIALALTSLLPNRKWQDLRQPSRTMPSREPLCDDCPYIPTFEILLEVIEQHGGRDAFIVTGETGCMVRAQLAPWEIMDVKYGMGSSIGLAAGLARTGVPQKIVALSGDSALLHSGLAELIDAVQAEVSMLVVVLANETTALSGGQPHPATAHDARGQARKPVNLAALIRAAGADSVRIVEPTDATDTQAAFEQGLATGGVAVVIVEQPCPRWETESQAPARIV
jgi:indolepyruvate ferredoxin oxidoreductase alpha subunit